MLLHSKEVFFWVRSLRLGVKVEAWLQGRWSMAVQLLTPLHEEMTHLSTRFGVRQFEMLHHVPRLGVMGEVMVRRVNVVIKIRRALVSWR